jgi:hypothetical protein
MSATDPDYPVEIEAVPCEHTDTLPPPASPHVSSHTSSVDVEEIPLQSPHSPPEDDATRHMWGLKQDLVREFERMHEPAQPHVVEQLKNTIREMLNSVEPHHGVYRRDMQRVCMNFLEAVASELDQSSCCLNMHIHSIVYLLNDSELLLACNENKHMGRVGHVGDPADQQTPLLNKTDEIDTDAPMCATLDSGDKETVENAPKGITEQVDDFINELGTLGI